MANQHGGGEGPLARVLGVLEHVKKQGSGYEARCPGPRHKHDDKHPSLSVGLGYDGRVLLKCHAGCEAAEVLAALHLSFDDLFERTTSGNPVRRFRLLNMDGQVVAEHVREEIPGDKIIRWERAGHNGLSGVKTADLPLYRLPDLLNAPADVPVVVCEGEKAAEALAELGMLAVGTVTGAAGTPSDDVLAPLQGRPVWLWPDNDDTGRDHMSRIAARLLPAPRWIDWPDAPAKGDAADYAAVGGTAGGVAELLRPLNVVVWTGPVVKTGKQLAAATFTAVRWAIPGLLPAGLTILAGRPKLGKSWLALGWALDIARGTVALQRMQVVSGETLYLALEDGERRMQERMAMMLGDADAPELFNVVTEWPRLNEGGLVLLDQWLTLRPNTRLVVIDTFKRIRPIEKGSQRLYDLDYDAIAPVAEMARQHNVAIVVVFHTRKMQSDDPLESVSGTLGVSGAADAVMVLRRERGQADASLFATGRDIEEQDLALRWEKEDTLGWALMGDAAEFRRSAERQAILDMVDMSPGITPVELSDALEKPRGAIRRLLFSMVRDAEVRNREGKYFPLARAREVTRNSGNTPSQSVTDDPLQEHRNGNSHPVVTTDTTIPIITTVPPVTAQLHGLCAGCGRGLEVHGASDPIQCRFREKNLGYYE